MASVATVGVATVSTAIMRPLGAAQIIARINSPNMRVRKSVHTLLLRVGKHHPQALIYPVTFTVTLPLHYRYITVTLPQALIYPLAVASHEARNHNHELGTGPADASSRGRWAERILQSMRAHCATLVEQARHVAWLARFLA